VGKSIIELGTQLNPKWVYHLRVISTIGWTKLEEAFPLFAYTLSWRGSRRLIVLFSIEQSTVQTMEVQFRMCVFGVEK
jgi:hypothetical protein